MSTLLPGQRKLAASERKGRLAVAKGPQGLGLSTRCRGEESACIPPLQLHPVL